MVLLCHLAVLFKHLHGFCGVVAWRQRLHKWGETQSVHRVRKRHRQWTQPSRAASVGGIIERGEAILLTLTFLTVWTRNRSPETYYTSATCSIGLWLFLELVTCFRKDPGKYSSRLFQLPPLIPLCLWSWGQAHKSGAVLRVKRTRTLNPAPGTWGGTQNRSEFLLSYHLWGKQVHAANFSYI